MRKSATFTMKEGRNSAKMSINGFPFEAVQWKEKTGQYWALDARGPLSKTITRELYAVCEDAVSVWAWGRVHRVTHRMMNSEVEVVKWRDEVLSLLRIASIFRTGIHHGLLDADYSDWAKGFDEADKRELQLHLWADKKYLDEMIEDIKLGTFGPAFELGNFLYLIRALLLVGIENRSAYHAIAKQELQKYLNER